MHIRRGDAIFKNLFLYFTVVGFALSTFHKSLNDHISVCTGRADLETLNYLLKFCYEAMVISVENGLFVIYSEINGLAATFSFKLDG